MSGIQFQFRNKIKHAGYAPQNVSSLSAISLLNATEHLISNLGLQHALVSFLRNYR